MGVQPQDPTPPATPGVSRRTTIRMIAVGSAGVAAGVGLTAVVARRDRGPARPRLFLSAREEATLSAFCEQLIPGDDVPGAVEAGVIDYIDLQLVGPHSRYQGLYRAGILSLQKTSLRLHNLPFEDLDGPVQTELVSRVEKGGCPADLWGDPSSGAFFGVVLDHTRQGFYGSPRHGGNRGYASYRMMGLAYPNLIGQNRPQAGRG